MEYMNNITIKYDDIEYDDTIGIAAPCDRVTFRVEIAVNDDYNCNDFELSIYGDFISYSRVRNVVDFIVEPNNTKNTRRGYITIYYRINPAVAKTIEVTQQAPDYSIGISETEGGPFTKDIELTFDTLLETSDENKTEKDIYVVSENGDWFISKTKQFAQITEEDYNYISDEYIPNYVEVNYDDGLNIEKKPDRLHITSYGKANLYYDSYYIITVKNKNDMKNSFAQIKINYKDTIDTFSFK